MLLRRGDYSTLECFNDTHKALRPYLPHLLMIAHHVPAYSFLYSMLFPYSECNMIREIMQLPIPLLIEEAMKTSGQETDLLPILKRDRMIHFLKEFSQLLILSEALIEKLKNYSDSSDIQLKKELLKINTSSHALSLILPSSKYELAVMLYVTIATLNNNSTINNQKNLFQLSKVIPLLLLLSDQMMEGLISEGGSTVSSDTTIGHYLLLFLTVNMPHLFEEILDILLSIFSLY